MKITIEAEKIFLKEILPLITKSISSITAELAGVPYHEDDECINRALYEGAGEKMKKRFCEYVDKTIDMHCEMLMNK